MDLRKATSMHTTAKHTSYHQAITVTTGTGAESPATVAVAFQMSTSAWIVFQ